MTINPGIFRDYDVRAVIPDELDKEGAIRIGQVLVEMYKPKTVAIGHDMRVSADAIAGGFKKGILKQGADVIDLGLISTDMAYFAAGKYKYDLALSVSASHNPSEYNGFKLVKKGAIAVSGNSGIYEIRDWAISKKPIKSAVKRGKVIKKDLTEEFIKHCLSFVNVKKIKPYKVVIDAGNAMAGYLIPKFAKHLPLKIVPMYFKLDGRFPNHIPNPLLPEASVALRKRVVKEKADPGIIFDGDADRMYFVDEKGKLVSGTIMTALLAKNILKKNPGETILYNSVTGKIAPETIKKYGGKPIRVRVGHTLIKEAMRKHDAYFAGEHSGHYFFKVNYYADSAFLAMLLALELISQMDQPLSQITKKYDKYPASGEINFEIEDKEGTMKKIEAEYKSKAKSTDWLDGITVWFKDYWFNVRPSGTQPLLRLNMEADDQQILDKNLAEVIKILENLGAKRVNE